MRISFTFLLLLGSLLLCAQTQDVYVVNQNINYLRWNDQHYQNSFHGLSFLMNDVKQQDAALYDQLSEEYLALQKRQKEAWIFLGVGGGLGTTLMLVGAFPKTEKRTNGFTTYNSYSANWGALGAGAGILLLASTIGAIKMVKSNDILNFANSFNRKSSGEKIEISLRPTFVPGSAGVSFSVVF